ncbi:lipopolysaccharide biosynthesis protein [Asinibacterium sp. OR53]|uniref:lipopolysaccharide biosynthesis protein n=1 Tax=Asinibacterium sp. OR53 TaxID=925409 RepID=UPI0004B5CC04|nr:oligosaccharide flippase family protein [Asinibacterium sp. OR53]
MKKLIIFSSFYVGSTAFLKLVGFFLIMWLARVLTVDDYAQFGLLYALQTGITTFALAGIIEAVVGLLKKYQMEEKRKLLFSAANISFFIITGIVIAIAAIILFVSEKNTVNSFFTLTCVLVSGALLAFASLQAQLVRIEERHVHSLLFNFFPPLAGFVGALVAFFIRRTVASFYIGSLIGIAIILLIFKICQIGFYSNKESVDETKLILIRIVPFIAIAFFGWLSGFGNNYVVKIFFDPSQVARFTFALSLASVMQLVASALNQVWAPRFYRIAHEQSFDEVEKNNKRIFGFLNLGLGLVGAILVATFPYVMRLLGGNLINYQNMRVEIFLLTISYLLLIPWWYCYNYFLVYDKGHMIMKIVVFTGIVGILIWLMLIWNFGSIGIYMGFLVQMLIRSVGIFVVARKIWALKYSFFKLIWSILIVLLGLLVSFL